MWFLTEFKAEIGKSDDEMYRLCTDRGIRIGGAHCKQKFLGLIISDEDGDAIIREVEALKEVEG